MPEYTYEKTLELPDDETRDGLFNAIDGVIHSLLLQVGELPDEDKKEKDD